MRTGKTVNMTYLAFEWGQRYLYAYSSVSVVLLCFMSWIYMIGCLMFHNCLLRKIYWITINGATKYCVWILANCLFLYSTLSPPDKKHVLLFQPVKNHHTNICTRHKTKCYFLKLPNYWEGHWLFPRPCVNAINTCSCTTKISYFL